MTHADMFTIFLICAIVATTPVVILMWIDYGISGRIARYMEYRRLVRELRNRRRKMEVIRIYSNWS